MNSKTILLAIAFHLLFQFDIVAQESPSSIESICDDDDRVTSFNKAVGRIWKDYDDPPHPPVHIPIGSAFIISDGKLVTAGHIASSVRYGPSTAEYFVEFHVPPSDINGIASPAADEDRYKIIKSSLTNDYGEGTPDSGDDWAVFQVSPNSVTGLLPIDENAQDAYLNIKQTTNLDEIRITGYGKDSNDPRSSYTLQTAYGPDWGSDGNIIRYRVDTEGRNSGSPIIDNLAPSILPSVGVAVGVHTFGGCSGSIGHNGGTSFYNDDFWDATGLGIDYTVDQLDEDDERLTGTNIGRWESFSFKEYEIQIEPLTFSAEVGTDEVLRADQTIVSNPEEKYNNWQDINDVENHRKILIETPDLFTSKFNKTYSGITIQNNFLDEPQLNPVDDEIEFKDPWFIDYQDPLYGNNLRNRGMNQTVWRSRSSPFNPDYDDPYEYGQSYKGIFLDQTVSSGIYYSVRSPITQDISLPQTGKTHKFYFQDWSSSGTDPLTQNNIVGGYYESPVVFRSSNASVYANLKGTQLSNDAEAYSNNNQRKFASNYFGILFSVYDSMEKIWIEYSTNSGQDWYIGNEGQPLFEGAQAKNPSLEFYNYSSTSSKIYVTAQLNNNGQSEIAVSVLNWQPSTLQEMAVWQLPSVIEEYDYLTNNFQPVIGFLTTDFLMIAYPIDYGTSGSVLWVEVGERLSNYSIDWNYQYNFISSTYTILTPTLYSTKPSLDPAQSEIYSCWLAYEEKTSTSYSQIMVAKLDLDFSNPIAGDFQVQYSEENNISYGSGYSKNYSPNIDCQIFENIGGKSDVVRLSWIGKRVTYEEEEELELGKAPPPSERRVLHKYKMFSNWSALYVYGDDVMGMSQNHGDNIIGNWQPYTLAWSEVNLGIVTNKYLRSHDTYPTPIRTLNTSGEQIQVNNGSDFDDMYVNSFQNSTLPYSFELSESLSGGLSKENSFAIKQGREGVVVKDEAGFYFAIGDIVLDGENINFVDFDDSLSIENQEILNEYLQSSSFAVSDNSSLTYGVQYGIVDSLLAVNSLTDGSVINFKVQLIDNQTGEVIGLFDNISYSQDNVFQYNNIGYQVDMTGIGNRTVQFKLLVETEAECDFFLSKRFADEVILGKAGYTQVKYQGSLAVTNYTIEQNYPNPFNPSTTIKYQIPQNGFVTIKVYDILGKEIATLVNEEKTSGRYEVNFNASSFTSGVYLYRLNVNDYVDVKKMMFLK